jgi:hypothetical protein
VPPDDFKEHISKFDSLLQHPGFSSSITKYSLKLISRKEHKNDCSFKISTFISQNSEDFVI